MTEGFDRVRPRSPLTTDASVPVTGHDAQGKRALFSSASEAAVPSMGSALVECSRCDESTVLGLTQAVRAAIPSLFLGLRIGHGEQVHVFQIGGRDYPTYLRCPACRRPSWVRFTVQI